MLTIIILFSSLLFAALYPLSFLISVQDPLKDNFQKFHLALPTIVAGVVWIFILLMNLSLSVNITTSIWVIYLLVFSAYYWKKGSPGSTIGILIPIILGITAFVILHNEMLAVSFLSIIAWLLCGLIFVSALFSMNLGHWYLNVHGLPIKHLRNATFVFWGALMVRFLWDLFFVSTSSVMHRGEEIPLYSFLFTIEGMLLCVAIFFGTLFPLVAIIFVKETIELKNTQSATGILYALLCAVCLGDFAYKYYFLRYQIFL